MKRLRIIPLIILLCLTALSAAPAFDPLDRLLNVAAALPSAAITAAQAQTQTAEWTVLIYMAADNDLESYGVGDVDELEFTASSDAVNVVVQIDRAEGYDTSNDDWTGTRRYYITRDTRFNQIRSEVLADLGEVNTGDAQTLRNFVAWGVNTFPAKRYALILWGHGSAWLGLAADESADYDVLTLPELTEALHGTLDDTGLPRFDILGFDACLMGAFEVYSAIAPFAAYAVGSPELIPGQGWDYTGLLDTLLRNPSLEGDGFGRAAVDSFHAFYTDLVRTYKFFTLGVVDLSRTDAMLVALRRYAAVARANSLETLRLIGAARSQSLVFPTLDDPTLTDLWGSTDVLLFMALLAQVTQVQDLKDAADAVVTAGADLVPYYRNSDALANSKALAIYFPRTLQVFQSERGNRYLREVPSDLSFWPSFLNGFFGLVADALPEVTIEALVDAAGDAQVAIQVEGVGVGDGGFTVEMPGEDGEPVVISYAPLPLSAAPVQHIGDFWPVAIHVIYDAATSASQQNAVPVLVFQSRSDPARGVLAGTVIRADGSRIPARLALDLATGEVVSAWGLRATADAALPYELLTAADDQFEPSWLRFDDYRRWVERPSGTRLALDFTRLRLATIAAPPGIYTLAAHAVMLGGGVDADSTTITVDQDGSLPVTATRTPRPCQLNDSWRYTYTVTRSDTLTGIAARYGVTVQEMARANCIANPDVIRPGQALRVPFGPTQTPALPAVLPSPERTRRPRRDTATPAPPTPVPPTPSPTPYIIP